MQGAVLESSEFAYLLATLQAPQVVGVDAPELFPTDPAERERMLAEGSRQLMAHGWLKQLEQPSQYHLNEDLLYLVAVVADPQFVVFTINTQPDGTAQVLLHYLAEPDLVELSVSADQKYTLSILSDRAALLARIQAMLDLPQVPAMADSQFVIEEPTFETIQDLAEEGQAEQATAILNELGINGTTGTSLVQALQSPETGSLVVVVRPHRGQIEAGRKASLFRNLDVVWLAKRIDAKSNTFSVETVQANTLPNILEAYLEFLSK